MRKLRSHLIAIPKIPREDLSSEEKDDDGYDYYWGYSREAEIVHPAKQVIHKIWQNIQLVGIVLVAFIILVFFGILRPKVFIESCRKASRKSFD